jgi:transposase
VTDREGGLIALASAGEPFATGVDALLGADVKIVKRNELNTFVVMPKRWTVERTFGWIKTPSPTGGFFHYLAQVFAPGLNHGT